MRPTIKEFIFFLYSQIALGTYLLEGKILYSPTTAIRRVKNLHQRVGFDYIYVIPSL